MMISGIKNKAGQKGPPASIEWSSHPWPQEVLEMQKLLWSEYRTQMSLKAGRQAAVYNPASQPQLVTIVPSSSTPSFQEENRSLIPQALTKNPTWWRSICTCSDCPSYLQLQQIKGDSSGDAGQRCSPICRPNSLGWTNTVFFPRVAPIPGSTCHIEGLESTSLPAEWTPGPCNNACNQSPALLWPCPLSSLLEN